MSTVALSRFRNSPSLPLYSILIFSLLFTSTASAKVCDWVYLAHAREILARPFNTPPLKVYTFRGIGDLSPEAFEIFHRTLFDKKPLTEADQKVLETEKVFGLYKRLKAAPEWIRNWNLAAGLNKRSRLIPESELEKANLAITTGIPELMKRVNVGDLIYKAHYYKEKLFLTPGDRARLKEAGVTEEELLAMAKEVEGRTFSDYDELRKEWETELAAKRRHLLMTYAVAPLHLARMMMLIPDVVTDHKNKVIQKRLLENPDHEFQAPEGITGRLRGLVPFSKAPHFDEKAYAQKLTNLKALRDEIKAHPELYKDAAKLQASITMVMRALVVAAVLAMKFGYDDRTLEESLDPEAPGGMHRDDAEKGIVEFIYFPDAREAAIRIGPKVYHYEFNSMVRLDSLPLYAPQAAAKGDHIRVQVKLMPEEIEKLKTKLEEERNRVFFGYLPYNTAQGQAMQDFSAATGIGVPSIFDRTHATSLPLVQIRNLVEATGLTQDRVQNVIYASSDGQGRGAAQLALDGLEATYIRSLPLKSLVILPLVEQFPRGNRDESEIIKRPEKTRDQYADEVRARAEKVKTWDEYWDYVEKYPDPFSMRAVDSVFDTLEADRLEAEAKAAKAEDK